MTTSTMSNSNYGGDSSAGGNPVAWLRDLSDTNSAIDEPNYLNSLMKVPQQKDSSN